MLLLIGWLGTDETQQPEGFLQMRKVICASRQIGRDHGASWLHSLPMEFSLRSRIPI